eukprot:gene5480-9298_t
MRSIAVFIVVLFVSVYSYTTTLNGFGRNNNGQLGVGTTTSSTYPLNINVSTLGFERVQKISAGRDHTLILGGNGVLYAFGRNQRGQLGDGTTTTRLRATPVDSKDKDWQKIAASTGDFNVVVRAGNQMKSFGFHSTGRLGLGSNGGNNAVTSPSTVNHNILDGDTIVVVAPGETHVVVLGTSGKMYAWGLNDEGQLGDGSLVQKNTPGLVSPGASSGHFIIGVVSGGKHSMAMASSGAVFAWGSNTHGQLGIGGTDTFKTSPTKVIGDIGHIIVIGAGARHSVVYNSRTFLYSFGDNTEGEIGLGSTSTVTTQRTPAYSHAFTNMIRKNWEWVLDIQGGDGFTILFTNKWNLYGFGKNNNGQLGDGSTTNSKDGVAMQRTERTSVRNHQVHGMAVGNEHVIFVASSYKWLPSYILLVGTIVALLL